MSVDFGCLMSPQSPTSPSGNVREKRAEVVKVIFDELKNKLRLSGELLHEEEAAIKQLQRIYTAKIADRSRTELERSVSFQGTTSLTGIDDELVQKKEGKFCGSFSGRTQRLIQMSRRDSDASLSNDTYSASSSGFSRFRNDHNSRDPQRRQLSRRRRLQQRQRIDPLTLNIDEMAGCSLSKALLLLYDELLNSKPPLVAYDLLIVTLRAHYFREGWTDLVEASARQCVKNHLLLSADQMNKKYVQTSETSSLKKLDEYKLQTLLHLYTFPPEIEETSFINESDLDKIANILRMLSFACDITFLQSFLDEDVMETFYDLIPRHLARLHEELNQPLPLDLISHASQEELDESVFEPMVLQSPERSNFSSLSQDVPEKSRPKKRASAIDVPRHHRFLTVPSNDAKQLKLKGRSKSAKISKSAESILVKVRETPSETNLPKKPRMEKRTLSPRTPKRQKSTEIVPETPVYKQQPLSEYRKDKFVSVLSRSMREVVTETPMKRQCYIPVVVRQSPRQHASTRALYSGAPDGLTVLDEDTEEDPVVNKKAENGHQPAATRRNNGPQNSSPLIKEKRDGLLKNFLIISDKKNNKTPAKSPATASSKRELKKSPSTKTAKKNLNGMFGHKNGVSSPKKHQQTLNFHVEHRVSETLSRKCSVDSEKSGGSSKSSESKASKMKQKAAPDVAYTLPSFAVDSYKNYVENLRRDRRRAGKESDDGKLFYARGTRRYSVFYDGRENCEAESTCYTDEKMAPMSRSGRKMKSSVEIFHLANYLLNINNENPGAPTVPKNLQSALNTPIRLYRKLRLAPKSNRRRALRQFCSLKFNADEFKVDSRKTAVNTDHSISNEEENGVETDDSMSVELNCVGGLVDENARDGSDFPTLTANSNTETVGRRRYSQGRLTRVKLLNRLDEMSETNLGGSRRHKNSLADLRTNSDPLSPTSGTASSSLVKFCSTALHDADVHEATMDVDSANGYFLRRRRLPSEGQIISNGRGSPAKVQKSMSVCIVESGEDGSDDRMANVQNAPTSQEIFDLAEAQLKQELSDDAVLKSEDPLLNRFVAASALLQLTTSPLCIRN